MQKAKQKEAFAKSLPKLTNYFSSESDKEKEKSEVDDLKDLHRSNMSESKSKVNYLAQQTLKSLFQLTQLKNPEKIGYVNNMLPFALL